MFTKVDSYGNRPKRSGHKHFGPQEHEDVFSLKSNADLPKDFKTPQYKRY